MNSFTFDKTLSPAENIELFFQHLETINSELSGLLKENISTIYPLPADSQQRTAKRTEFHKSILKKLEEEE